MIVQTFNNKIMPKFLVGSAAEMASWAIRR